MKLHLTAIILFISLYSYSQSNLPNNFKIGDYLEVYGQDSLRVYFSCTGSVVDKQCANFYRVGKMDSTIANFMGEFCDYNIDNTLYLKATMVNNSIEGYARYYFAK